MTAKRRRDAGGGDAGGRSGQPKRLGDVLNASLGRLATSEQALAYSAWARAAGEQVASGARPRAFARGLLTVECTSSVWANELTYLGSQILRRMDELAPGHPVRRFRFVVERSALRCEEEPVEHASGLRPPAPPRDTDAARTEAEAVRDERLRAAIEAVLRASSTGAQRGSGDDHRVDKKP